jgi:phage recombination protein Bet
MNALVDYQGKQLDLIRRTVAKDCEPAEFDQFIHICKHTRLDPIRRQIYCFIFHKNDPARRQMTVVTSIGGYRAIADRTGNYRPDENAARIEIDSALVSPCNPLGIGRCEVMVHKFSHGQWFPVTGEAHWDEYAPIITGGEEGFEWVATGETYPAGHEKAGKPKMKKKMLGEIVKRLDPLKTGWTKMPRIMIAKCAEANALRKAWPDDFAMLQTEEETDRAHSLDLSASELADEAAAGAKLALMGGADALTVMWEHGAKLERVPSGKFCDAVLQWASQKDRTSTELEIWWSANLPARGEYKARHGAEYLEFQKEWERIKARVETEEITQDPVLPGIVQAAE